MTRYLLVYNHPDRGEQRFDLENHKSYRIGSKPDNDIFLPQNDVSRYHAILRTRDGTFQLTDLGSKNGTYVNGQRTASAEFQCGDLLNLSSARLVVVEVGSGAYTMTADAKSGGALRRGKGEREDTQGYPGEATVEDMVSLLITTSSAVRRGAVAEPLTWAVDRFGLRAAVILYRDSDDNVAIVSSAGDLGPLVRSSATLAKIVRDQKGYRGGTRIQQVSELGETLLVAPMQRDHVLIVRFEGQPPAIGDVRAVIAATEAVLCSGNPPSPETVMVDRRDPEVRRFGSPLQRIAGLSEAIAECKRQAAEYARRDEPVLITGEKGTGKALFARVIHDLSPRREGPFVVWGRSEASGEKYVAAGSPTVGAALDAAHWLPEFAVGGTLYVEEVASLPQQDLARLREALSRGRDAPPQVRVIAATSLEPGGAAAAGGLAGEVMGVLGGLQLRLPPLRERSEDIPLLVTAFRREAVGQRHRGVGFTVDALESLARYRWPDNVRELRGEVLRLMTHFEEDQLVEVSDLAQHILEGLVAEDVPPPDLGALARRPLAAARDEFERWRILRALHDSGGNQSQAAQGLGLSRAGLFKKMRRLGLNGWTRDSPSARRR